MPNIPLHTSQIAARTGRTSGPFLDQNVSPNVFGADVGRAAQGVGEAIGNAGGAVFDMHERKQREKVANTVAQSDFTPLEVETRQEVGPDGAGYRDSILAKYDEFVETQANTIDDDKARMAYRQQMMNSRHSVSSKAALYEENLATVDSKAQADASLMTLENKIMVDPTMYETYVQQGADVISTRPGFTQRDISAMQTQWRQNSARGRFTGMLEAATSVDDIDNIEAELTGQTEGGPDWTKEFAPDDFVRMKSGIDTTRKAFITLQDASARAAIDTLEDRNAKSELIPREELEIATRVVRESTNPITQGQLARILRDQDMIRTYRGANQAQIRADTGGGSYPNVPAPVSTAINQATQAFDISAAYLGSTVTREYGGLFKGENTDYGVKAGTSSATGVMQFVDSTWLGLMKDGATPQRMGVDITGKSDAEILEMRKDPRISVMAGAALAERNKIQLQNELGRSVDDAEIYMAHFLGAGGAATLIRAVANDPTASAASILPAAAGANRNVFYGSQGGAPVIAFTVQQVYNNIARTFVTAPSHVKFADDETRTRLADEMDTALKQDPMSFAQKQGQFDVSPLTDEASFVARGEAARAASNHYSIPIQDFKPFTIDEAAELSKRMETGNADDVLAVLSSVQQLGGDVARAGFKQLDEKDQVYAFAAGLSYEANSPVAAGDVVRGRKRLEENPALKDGIGDPGEIANTFGSITGGALFEIAPRDRQAIQDAAFAHYVETYTARGGAGLDRDAFEHSIQAVLGGTASTPAVANINGTPTVLPPGVDGQTLETALDKMTVADWTRMSPQKLPPRYVTGQVVDPSDMANEAVLRSVSGGQYKIMFDDGTFAITGEIAAGGRYEAYLFAPDPKAVNEVAERPVDQSAGAYGYPITQLPNAAAFPEYVARPVVNP